MTLLKGGARLQAARTMQRRYDDGDSVRAIARATGRSYGYVHRLLAEVGTQMRPRHTHRRPTP